MAMTPDRWLTIILFLVGVLITWIVSRYYYRRSDKKRVPTFILQSTRILSEPELTGSGGLSVVHNGREVGKTGITKARIYFWNSGTLPILEDDVLEPYTITLPVAILSCSVLKFSRDVVGLVLHEDSSNTLTLRFAVLEPGDGTTLEIIYDGPPSTGITFKGACLDAHKPTVLPPDPIYSVPKSKRFRETYGSLTLELLKATAPILGLLGVVWLAQRFLGEHVADIFGFVLAGLLGVAFLLAVLVVLGYQFKRMTAPYLPPDIKE